MSGHSKWATIKRAKGAADAGFRIELTVLASDARLQQSPDSWRIAGDPTEGALVVAAAKAGLWRADMEQSLPRVAEIPFDSDRKRMVTVHTEDGLQDTIDTDYEAAEA